MNGIFLTNVVESSEPRATSESFKTAIIKERSKLWSLECFKEVSTSNIDKNANII